jgi:hypothetical protein
VPTLSWLHRLLCDRLCECYLAVNTMPLWVFIELPPLFHQAFPDTSLYEADSRTLHVFWLTRERAHNGLRR